MTPAESRALAVALGQLSGGVARVDTARLELAAVCNSLDDFAHGVVKLDGLSRHAATVLERMIAGECDRLDLAAEQLRETRRLLARVQQ